MGNLWLVQYLCPRRHAIAAAPYDRDVTDPDAIEGALRGAIQTAQLNPWCGLCGSRVLVFEHGKLRWTDWDEAVAALRAAERAQAHTRLLVQQMRESN